MMMDAAPTAMAMLMGSIAATARAASSSHSAAPLASRPAGRIAPLPASTVSERPAPRPGDRPDFRVASLPPHRPAHPGFPALDLHLREWQARYRGALSSA